VDRVEIGASLEFWGHGPVFIPRHVHRFVIGATGSGKSTLLKNLIKADIDAGDGCCVIDPHGELVSWVLARIPKHRTNDVIWFDPTDRRVIGLNPLERKNVLALEQTLKVVSQIWGADAWGPQSDFISRNVGLAVLEAVKRPTIFHVLRYFLDDDYGDRLFARVKSSHLKAFHRKIHDDWDARQKEQAQAPPLNKLDSFMKPAIRHVVGQEKGLDVRRAIDEKKIILCPLPKRKLGPEAGAFIGAILLWRILFAAFDRKTRDPFQVYIDEFHNFTRGESPEYILSETRKYGVFLTLADQTIAQLPEGSEQAIFGNVAVIVCGGVGAEDAKRLAGEFRLSEPGVLQDLTTGEWFLRVRGKDAIHFKGKDAENGAGYLPQPDPWRIKRRSRALYGRERKEIERALNRILGG